MDLVSLLQGHLPEILTAVGQTVTIDGRSVYGVVDTPYGESLQMAGTMPTLLISVADAAGVNPNSPVVIGSQQYRAGPAEPDGLGLVLFKLRAA
jgi:hypothetical protein